MRRLSQFTALAYLVALVARAGAIARKAWYAYSAINTAAPVDGGSGRTSDAVWRIVKSATATLRGAYGRPTRPADTWTVVRVATTPHRFCHTGGYRESLAHPLAGAPAATRASGY